MKKSLILAFASAGLLISCGGTPSENKGISFSNAKGNFTFPVITPFDDSKLPAPTENEIVAFCPVNAGYSNVYNWVRAEGQPDTPFNDWPGVPMTEKYDDNWYKVTYKGYTDLWIIFNGGGQTQDMHMDHPGYWWFWQSDGDMHDSVPVSSWLDSAKFTDEKTIQVVASKNITEFVLKEGEKEIFRGNPSSNAIDISLGSREVDIEKGYSVSATLEGGVTQEMNVAIQSLFKTDGFNAKYAYEGDDLGLTYTKTKSTFKVWSPLSTSIKLRLYRNGTPVSVDASRGSDEVAQEVAMTKGEKGVWTASLDGDFDGYYYTYVVTNATYQDKEIVDPYVRSTGVNGLRGMILDLSRTNPEGWENIKPHAIDRKAATVWECHIADLTSSTTWTGTEENRKKYAGFHESGTTYTEEGKTVKTGFDHVKELGVNEVQILPMFDQANDEVNVKFNWGYNPLNYNVPEGAYSSNPYDGAVRVKELKELIADYNKAGINIIMDVVYNHVNGAIMSNFDVLFPGYYFRYNKNGSLSNGSGCGNETASDHYMFRKFMIDSTTYWAKEYKLGGFRFDLMGLHDVETMNLLTAACQKVFPEIIIYGEPWMGGTSTDDYESAAQANGNKYVGYGQFNDGLRDSLIKGGLNAAESKGWATDLLDEHSKDMSSLVAGIKGTTLSNGEIPDPNKTVNYVTCHDNYTLYDRIAYNWGNRAQFRPFVKKMAMLAQSIVFTSQGTAFMLSGEEFLRTKGGDHNSYESSYEVNELNYSLKVQNFDMFEHYQKLIRLKQTVSGLHLNQEEASKLQISFSSSKDLITYEIVDEASGKTYKIAHQATWTLTKKDDVLVLENPTPVDFSSYSQVYLDTGENKAVLGASTILEAGQTLIAVK
ncbi:MAG: type I pullulanase [Candidatus Enteromonas sp.]|nr:type I pullulanase [Candidatus Enteromonas sp.]